MSRVAKQNRYMDARPVAGKWVRLIGALVYASSSVAVALWMLPKSAATLPLLFTRLVFRSCSVS